MSSPGLYLSKRDYTLPIVLNDSWSVGCPIATPPPFPKLFVKQYLPSPALARIRSQQDMNRKEKRNERKRKRVKNSVEEFWDEVTLNKALMLEEVLLKFYWGKKTARSLEQF